MSENNYSLIKAMNLNAGDMSVYLNTGTMFDVAVGRFEQGIGGLSVLNGGFAPITGIIGTSGNYKSTTVQSMAINVLDIYPRSEIIYVETENNLPSMDRFDDIAEKEVDRDRIGVIDVTHSLDDTTNMIKEICAHKEKNRKDLMVQTPFIHPKTLKPIMIFIPTLVIVDSFSLAKAVTEEGTMDGNDISSSKMNMMYMQDGAAKARFLRHAPKWAAEYGLYFILTAHIGKNTNIENSHLPVAKQHQYMKQDQRIKGVSNQFDYLTNILVQNMSSVILTASDKSCQYPYQSSPATEINMTTSRIIRCKNNHGGSEIPFIISQISGIDQGLTDYHYLRKNGNFGLTGSDRSQTCGLVPNVTMTRTTIREKLKENYELKRALQILGQLLYIQSNWAISRFKSVNMKMSGEEFVEKIVKGGSIAVSDVINSRGYWTYGDDPRPYMSIIDIMKALS